MPLNPVYQFSFIGSNGKIVTRRYEGVEIDEGSDAADYAEAAVRLEALRTAINVVTDANVQNYGMFIQGSQALGGIPADADVHEEMALSMDITPAGEPTKFATISLPAPSDSVFLASTGPNRDVVDIANLNMVALANALAANVLISDGEAINSLSSGYRRARGGRTS
jgi:hypothetical protein